MTSRDLDGAIGVLAESGRQIPAHTLSGAAWVDLAKACLARAQAAGAEPLQFAALGVLAYRRAAEVAPNGPLAPQAFLQAARLYDEVLGDRARSDALLAELARRYPNTAEGQFAARRVASKQ
jgi:Tfp pilus assembly protein PilN